MKSAVLKDGKLARTNVAAAAMRLVRVARRVVATRVRRLARVAITR
jgi:hypothetical protein